MCHLFEYLICPELLATALELISKAISWLLVMGQFLGGVSPVAR